MSYRIQYDSKKHPWEKPMKHRKTALIAITICVVFLLIGFFGPEKLTFLLPGEPDVTTAALENMTNSLQAGDSLKEAIVTFCQEILDNADIAQ